MKARGPDAMAKIEGLEKTLETLTNAKVLGPDAMAKRSTRSRRRTIIKMRRGKSLRETSTRYVRC